MNRVEITDVIDYSYFKNIIYQFNVGMVGTAKHLFNQKIFNPFGIYKEMLTS